MKEIVVISGKGGTGKTSITAAFAHVAQNDVVAVDCDVDAADMHILLKPDNLFSEDFYSGEIAKINQKNCSACGVCFEICRFKGIDHIANTYSINEINCEGCRYCANVCPSKSIDMTEVNVGKWYISNTRLNCKLVHAKLNIGADNSGKLVSKVKTEARKIAEKEQKDYILIDGSPGISCPVIASLSGSNYVVLVTEPSVSGFHDLKRVYELVKKFKISAGCIINKADINIEMTRTILDYLYAQNINHLASIPFNDAFTSSLLKEETIVESKNYLLKLTIEETWNNIVEIIKEEQ